MFWEIEGGESKKNVQKLRNEELIWNCTVDEMASKWTLLGQKWDAYSVLSPKPVRMVFVEDVMKMDRQ
jgi:hypothetical protein